MRGGGATLKILSAPTVSLDSQKQQFEILHGQTLNLKILARYAEGTPESSLNVYFGYKWTLEGEVLGYSPELKFVAKDYEFGEYVLNWQVIATFDKLQSAPVQGEITVNVVAFPSLGEPDVDVEGNIDTDIPLDWYQTHYSDDSSKNHIAMQGDKAIMQADAAYTNLHDVNSIYRVRPTKMTFGVSLQRSEQEGYAPRTVVAIAAAQSDGTHARDHVFVIYRNMLDNSIWVNYSQGVKDFYPEPGDGHPYEDFVQVSFLELSKGITIAWDANQLVVAKIGDTVVGSYQETEQAYDGFRYVWFHQASSHQTLEVSKITLS